jgi:hypothetical protein
MGRYQRQPVATNDGEWWVGFADNTLALATTRQFLAAVTWIRASADYGY